MPKSTSVSDTIAASTAAPITGRPSSSTTLPWIVLVCANARVEVPWRAPAARKTATHRRQPTMDRVMPVDQSIEQAPGPRGSPQLPQGAGEALGRSVGDEDETANLESNLSRSTELHDGQEGVTEPRMIFSNRLPHPRHSYS